MSAPSSTRISPARLALAARKLRGEREDLALLASDPIAVIGMACRFPAGSDSPEEYWAALEAGRDGIVEMPESRWPKRAALEQAQRLGGYLDAVDGFDAEYFGIAPREASQTDPQQRLLLEVVWEALWDAGIEPAKLAGTDAGVFAAIYNSDYARLHFTGRAELGAYAGIGTAHSVAAGRISYLLDIHGPSIAVDTACSSSLVATHMAVRSLRAGECGMAIVGASSLKILPDEVQVFSRWGMLAGDGKCKTFDAAADGFAAGEGAGTVILKRLSDALQDGDRVRAVIRGTAVNHDGRTTVLTAPSGLAQQAVIRAALANAQLDAAEIGYIETHGTGTSLGDPIEVEALQAVYGARNPDAAACVLGAVKTNLGHLEAAAGLAGLIKSVLCLEHEAIPGNLHFHRLNPQISLDGTRFLIPAEPVAWPRGPRARVAGISSFGLGGTNAHIIVEEAPALPAGRTRLPLPKRVWHREHCWLPEGPSVVVLPVAEAAVHPLLGRPVQSAFVQGRLFEAQYSTDTVSYLRDHQLGRRPLLPFAAFLEIAQFAGRQVFGDTAFSISDFSTAEPLFLTAEPQSVQSLISETSVEIASWNSDFWVKHARGSLRRASAAPEIFDLAGARARCLESIEASEVYRRLELTGLHYGPAFRAIVSVWRSGDESLALIRLPADLQRSGSDYALHPVLLDGCLQTLMVTLPELSDELLLPIAVDEYRLLQSGARETWAHVSLRSFGPELITADVSIADSAGKLIARLRGFEARRTTLAALGGEAKAPTYEVAWHEQPRNLATRELTGSRWLIADESAADCEAVAAQLRSVGATVVVAPLSGATSRLHEETWTDLLLYLRPDDTPPGAWQHPERTAVEFVLELTASLKTKQEVPRLHVVAPLACSVLPGADVSLSCGALMGLLRTLACEHPDTSPVLIDPGVRDETTADFVVHEVLAEGSDPLVAMRNGIRYVARMVAAPPLNRDVMRLASGSPGVLDALHWEAAERAAPHAGEIEIEVRAHGLNFRDVLNALGVFDIRQPRFGAECAGVVARVGAAVHSFRPGDCVVAFAPFSLQSYATVPEAYAAALPRAMTFAQAATIPVAFLTALYGFQHLAHLGPGQRVLIHAAAGGLGLAAVQLARRAGAEVYATAGSDRKREFLHRLGVRHVFDSRSTSFRDDVLRVTGGAGVDIVLNSLSGELIQAGLESLALNGCFLEVGKRGIRTSEEVRRFRADIRHYAFDLGDVAKEDPELVRMMMAELMPEFASGRLEPLPTMVYPVEQTATAFRTMAQGGHIGKIVFTRLPQSEPLDLSAVVAGGTTLLVGGLGALGRSVAEWLASRGAKRLVLAGRTASSDAEFVSSLQATGTEVVTERMDVADPASVETVLARIRATGTPLKAVFHVAGVVRDGLLESESWESFRQAAAVKIDGAWNLHRLTENDPVELMVFFSSAAAVLGSPGQGSYATGNAFLDALAHYRSSRGLATLSIDWGAWAAAGMAARLAPEHAARLERQGIRSLESSQALAALGRAIAERRTQVAVLNIAWDRFLTERPASDRAFFSELQPLQRKEAESPGAASIREMLLDASQHDRRSLLVAHVRDCARHALSLNPESAVQDDVPLQEVGLDSLMAIDMKNELAQSLGLSLSAGLLFNYPTVGQLTSYLLELLPAAAPAASVGEEDENTALAAMSEEEAERLLLEELEQAGSETTHA